MDVHRFFTSLSNKITKNVGSPYASFIAVLLILAWSIGLFFVDSGITNQLYLAFLQVTIGIITFLMVFFIQHSQNIESTATQLKLDHLIHQLEQTDNRFAGIEEKTEPELRELKKEMRENAEQ